MVPKPTPASGGSRSPSSNRGNNPITGFVALTTSHVMRLNYDELGDIFDARRAEFKARGAGDLLREI
jgi:hypothetical protein